MTTSDLSPNWRLRFIRGGHNLEFGELFARQTGEMRPFVKEFEQRSLAVKPDAADKVVNLVAIKAAGRGQEDEVAAAFDEVGGFDRLGFRAIA